MFEKQTTVLPARPITQEFTRPALGPTVGGFEGQQTCGEVRDEQVTDFSGLPVGFFVTAVCHQTGSSPGQRPCVSKGRKDVAIPPVMRQAGSNLRQNSFRWGIWVSCALGYELPNARLYSEGPEKQLFFEASKIRAYRA